MVVHRNQAIHKDTAARKILGTRAYTRRNQDQVSPKLTAVLKANACRPAAWARVNLSDPGIRGYMRSFLFYLRGKHLRASLIQLAHHQAGQALQYKTFMPAPVQRIRRLKPKKPAADDNAAAGFVDLCLNAQGIRHRPHRFHAGQVGPFDRRGVLPQEGTRAVQDLLRAGNLPTALFASADSLAIGAMRALHEAGIRVPEDMAVAGFDDITLADSVWPSLTTVKAAPFEMGQAAVRELMAQIEDPGLERRICKVDTHLVIRNSTSNALSKNP